MKYFNNRTQLSLNVIQQGLKKYLTKSSIIQFGVYAAVSASALFITEAIHLTSFINGRDEKITLSALPVVNPTIKYGFALDTFSLIENKVQSDDVFVPMLMTRGLTYKVADSLAKEAKQFYNFDKIINGKPYMVLTRDPHMGYDYFIYEPEAKRYIIFDLKNPSVKEVKREITVKELEASGKIKGSLWETMVASGMSYELTDKVEDALKYQFDLRKFQDGDEFKVIWEEEIVDGRSIGVRTMKAAYFKEKEEKEPIYAIYFDNGSQKGWYSKNGLPMRDGFLKSPLKYSNITSHYSMNRLHPILGYNRPHFGTDYAAPHGTPIMSVADGVVTAATYEGGNGNYVKIKHMSPYETQYLHLSRFAKGIKPGARVKQGEVIGYVGSTGLATGPHVCFRFWKNGSQVNHLREKLPQISTFSTADAAKFKEVSYTMIERMNKIPFLSDEDMQQRKKLLQALRGKP